MEVDGSLRKRNTMKNREKGFSLFFIFFKRTNKQVQVGLAQEEFFIIHYVFILDVHYLYYIFLWN